MSQWLEFVLAGDARLLHAVGGGGATPRTSDLISPSLFSPALVLQLETCERRVRFTGDMNAALSLFVGMMMEEKR